jgi:hypothetical protein
MASRAARAEHGGFSHDDTNVMMLLSNPGLQGSTVTSPVETMQAAPASSIVITILADLTRRLGSLGGW